MEGATLLVKLDQRLTGLVDEIIADRVKRQLPISISNTEEELARAKEIQDREGTSAATKYLKSKERERVRQAREQNKVPSRTAIVLEVLDYILPAYKTMTQ